MSLCDSVDIWFLENKNLFSLSYDWESILSEEEKQRANRFHFEKDQRSFIIYHACKRLILSSYLQKEPQEIMFSVHEKGKPFLKNDLLTFNLSHTKSAAIIAVSHGREIGVDIEEIRNSADYLNIAKRFFHPEEYHQLINIQDVQKQRRTFFTLWTAKEALLKAKGDGITAGLNHFCVQFNLNHPGEIKHSDSGNIALTPLETPDNYVATLAIVGEQKPVFYQNFQHDPKITSFSKHLTL